jgi:hypothetical protein
MTVRNYETSFTEFYFFLPTRLVVSPFCVEPFLLSWTCVQCQANLHYCFCVVVTHQLHYHVMAWRITCMYLSAYVIMSGRLCGLVVRVRGYRSRDAGFYSRRYQVFWEVVGLERSPLSLVSITEELLEWKSSGSGSGKSRLTAVGIRCSDHATPSTSKIWH